MTDQQQIETVKAIARQVNSIVRDFRDMEAERDRALATLRRVRNLADAWTDRGTDGVPIRPHHAAERIRAILDDTEAADA